MRGLVITSFVAAASAFTTPALTSRVPMSQISMSGKGFGDGEATRDQEPTPYATRDPEPTSYHANDPKVEQQAIHKGESFADYLVRRQGGAPPTAAAPSAAEATRDLAPSAFYRHGAAEEAMNDAELSSLKQSLELLEKEQEEVLAATEACKAEAAAAAEEWNDGRVRLQTDFDNMRIRAANQALEAQLDEKIKLLQEFLPVLDNFDRARESCTPVGYEDEAVSSRYDAMYDALQAALAEMGVEKIPTVGEEFDYNLHMAIQTVPNDEYKEGTVSDEMQPGCTCEGKLVRPAYVVVSSG